MASNDSQVRIAQFKDRARHALDDVESDSQNRWEYIRVHEYDQYKCDAYWKTGDDVFFLEVMSAEMDTLGRRGLYARWNNWEPPHVVLVAFVKAPAVTRAILESVMAQFDRLELARLQESLADKLTLVDTWDGSDL
ncbi:MAG: hypothetical protein GC159_12450 [Phycisphaera sp.]|nr:hypothetical protein [Phycisphaera sp.]